MAKTPLFKKLKAMIRDAKLAMNNKLSDSQVQERLEMNASRREFLKQGAVGVTAAAATSVLTSPDAVAQSSADPVAILGAGAAGLAAAYNLSKAGIPFHIYDGQTRVGGRMLTARNVNADGHFADIGGELVDSGHEILLALAKENGITIQEYQTKGLEHDTYFGNGHVYSHAAFITALKPFLVLLNEAIEDLWVGADEEDYLVYQNADKIVNMRKYDKMSIRDFLYSPKMLQRVDRWLLDFIDVAYLAEYGRETNVQPAINLLYLIGYEIVKNDFSLFGLSDEAYRIKGGSECLTNAMYDSIKLRLSKAGVAANYVFHLGHKLTKIAYTNGKFQLSFNGGAPKTYSNVICTLPFSTLRLVDGIDGLSLSHPKKLALFGAANGSVKPFGMGSASKIFMTFSQRVWRTATPKIPANDGSFFGTGTFKNQCLWESSRLQPGTRGLMTAFLGGNRALKADDSYITSAVADMNLLYPGINAKFQPRTTPLDPRTGSVKNTVNWNLNKYTLGSYGCALLGQWSTMIGGLDTNELGNRMYFAGEHTSLDYQGYMEGGFESGMRVANEIIAKRTGKPIKDHYAWAAKILG